MSASTRSRWARTGSSTATPTTHYLHHKYFEVNYGDALIPLDHWFGTWHDGSPEGEAAMRERQRRRLKRTAVRPGAETITGKVVAP